jgi:hypothetical protein
MYNLTHTPTTWGGGGGWRYKVDEKLHLEVGEQKRSKSGNFSKTAVR